MTSETGFGTTASCSKTFTVWWNSICYQKSCLACWKDLFLSASSLYALLITTQSVTMWKVSALQVSISPLVYIYILLVDPRETHWNVLKRATHISSKWGVVFIVNPVVFQSKWRFWLITSLAPNNLFGESFIYTCTMCIYFFSNMFDCCIIYIYT